jgi:anti-sigma B factor antagonist
MVDRDPVTDNDALGTVETAAGTVVAERQGNAVVLRVTGALDLALAPKLQQLVDRAGRLDPELLVLDLTDVDFLASAGMAVLVKTHRQHADTATGVRVVAAGRVTLRPLELTQLTRELDLYPTLAEALAGR